ncbi:SRPBCC domain-containing protein [Psychromicrobium sp. YIM B11713]|uniref:SRPBCC domain-containing protein n=1 Tax=Psychromicrobium sp. YIM B11713 TaxID=3145233 RepID=UPI00374E35CA
MTAKLSGRVEAEGGADWLVLERRLPGDQRRSWQALTESTLLDRFIGRWEGDPSSGEVSFFMTAEGSTEASSYRIIECTAPGKLVVESDFMGSVWHLALTLDESADGSLLRFAQRLGEGIELAEIGPGWEYYLDRLLAVESGGTVDSIRWDDYYPSPGYQALKG